MTKTQIANELVELLSPEQLRKAAVAGIKAHFRGERGEHRIADDLARLVNGDTRKERDFDESVILRRFN